MLGDLRPFRSVCPVLHLYEIQYKLLYHELIIPKCPLAWNAVPGLERGSSSVAEER